MGCQMCAENLSVRKPLLCIIKIISDWNELTSLPEHNTYKLLELIWLFYLFVWSHPKSRQVSQKQSSKIHFSSRKSELDVSCLLPCSWPHVQYHSLSLLEQLMSLVQLNHTLTTPTGQYRKVSVLRSSFAAELCRGLPSSSLGLLKLVPWVIQSGSGDKMDPIQNPIQLTSVANYI